MNAVVTNVRRQAVDDGSIPVGPAPLSAAHQLDARVRPFHHRRERARFLDVVLGRAGADLPGAVHLVAEAPVSDVVRRLVAVGAAVIGPGRVARPVAVFDPGLGLIHAARTHVDADVGLGTERAAVLDELVGAERIGLLAAPGKLHAPRPSIARTDAVHPVVAAYEVAAWPAQNR